MKIKIEEGKNHLSWLQRILLITAIGTAVATLPPCSKGASKIDPAGSKKQNPAVSQYRDLVKASTGAIEAISKPNSYSRLFVLEDPVMLSHMDSYFAAQRRMEKAYEYKLEHEIDWIIPKQVSRWWPIVQNSCAIYKCNPVLITAMLWQESAGNSKAVGRDGDTGLMQIVTRYHKRTKNEDLLNPQINIYEGSRIYMDFASKFPKNVSFGVAAYNTGYGIIKKDMRLTSNGVEYVTLVMNHLRYIEKHAERESMYSSSPIVGELKRDSKELILQLRSSMNANVTGSTIKKPKPRQKVFMPLH